MRKDEGWRVEERSRSGVGPLLALWMEEMGRDGDETMLLATLELVVNNLVCDVIGLADQVVRLAAVTRREADNRMGSIIRNKVDFRESQH